MSDRAFARSFVALLGSLPASEHGRVFKHLARMLARRGELSRCPRLLAHIEEEYAHSVGGRTIVIETARPLALSDKKHFTQHTTAKDVIRYIVRPELVAGSRITINDSRVIDCSLAGRLGATTTYGS